MNIILIINTNLRQNKILSMIILCAILGLRFVKLQVNKDFIYFHINSIYFTLKH